MQTLQHLVTSLNVGAAIVAGLAAIKTGGKEGWYWVATAGFNGFCAAVATL